MDLSNTFGFREHVYLFNAAERTKAQLIFFKQEFLNLVFLYAE